MLLRQKHLPPSSSIGGQLATPQANEGGSREARRRIRDLSPSSCASSRPSPLPFHFPLAREVRSLLHRAGLRPQVWLGPVSASLRLRFPVCPRRCLRAISTSLRPQVSGLKFPPFNSLLLRLFAANLPSPPHSGLAKACLRPPRRTPSQVSRLSPNFMRLPPLSPLPLPATRH